MSAIEEKRLFADRIGRTVAFVAAELGIATVGIADDRVGEVRIARRCTPLDIAAGGGCLAVATESGLLSLDGEARPTDDATDPDSTVEFVSMDGPDATVVGFESDQLHVAEADGTIHTRDDDGWRTLGRVEGTVAAIDGPFIATDAGVYRVTDTPQHVGLTAVRDVSATGVPRAATADGLFTLGNGWLATVDGDFRVVAGAPDGESAHAATADTVYAQTDGEWQPIDVSLAGPIVDIASGETPAVIADDGTIALAGETGWRTYPLGLPDVRGLAIPRW